MSELPNSTTNQESHQISYKFPWWCFAIIAALAIALVISLAFLYSLSVKQKNKASQNQASLERYNLPVNLNDPAVKGNYLSYELTGVIDSIDKNEAAQKSIWVIKTANQNSKYTLTIPWETIAFVNMSEKEIPKVNYRPSETYVREGAKVGDHLRILMRTDLQKKVHSIDQILQLK